MVMEPFETVIEQAPGPSVTGQRARPPTIIHLGSVEPDVESEARYAGTSHNQ